MTSPPGSEPWGIRPLPWPDALSRPFFEAAAAGRLVLQRCTVCGEAVFYPRPYCTLCAGELEWTEASGSGTVYTFTVIHQNLSGAFIERVPYVVAMIELAEGVRMMGNLVECPPQSLRIGMPVRACFVEAADGIGIPLWRPA